MTLSLRVWGWVKYSGQSRDALVEHVRANPTPWLIGLLWFVLTYLSTIWVWGVDPKTFASPDEALNRHAAALLATQDKPFLYLPFRDPEDLAHPRQWVSTGEYAIPSYPPVAIYAYAALLRLRGLGWVSALPALAAAAFASGVALLLPRGRQWLALPTPLLAFPAFYWLPRPWMNLSVLLICVCWSVFFWASWRQSQRLWQLMVAIGLVGAAAAVRPDYAAYLMSVALLLGLAQATRQRRAVVGAVLVSGALAVAVNLVLNWQITGHPTVAAYQISIARDEGVVSATTDSFGILRQLLAPMGIPPLDRAMRYLGKYWLEMGGIFILPLGALWFLVSLRHQGWLSLTLHAAAIVVMLCFVLSRMDPGLHGASEPDGFAKHSMPRYWSPIYLLAAVPIPLLVARWQNRAGFTIAAAVVCLVAFVGGYEIALRGPGSFAELKVFADKASEALPKVRQRIPPNAMVYTASLDKAIWSGWRVGMIGAPGPSARSMRRAVAAGLDVWVYEESFKRRHYERLARSMAREGLVLQPVGSRGIYHVKRKRRR